MNRLNRLIPVSFVALAAAVAIGCTGQTPSTPSSPAPGASQAPAAAVSFKTDVTPVLTQHCAACHTAGRGGAAAVEMFSAAGEAQHAKIAPAIANMIAAVKAGRMPKGKPGSVPEAQIKTLENWQSAGAPNN